MPRLRRAWKKRSLLAGFLTSLAAYGALIGSMQRASLAGDELYRFSGRKELKEQQQQKQKQEQAGQAEPQVELWQLNQRLPEKPPASQQPGTANQQPGTAAANTSVMNSKGGPPGSNQLPEGTATPLPGGGPKLGVGPVGPGGTSRATTDPTEGPNRYITRPPSWENLNETDAGRNRNEPGAGNTSVANGSNIFGTTPVPFVMGSGNRWN